MKAYLKALLRHPLGVVGTCVVGGLILLAVAAPYLAPYDPFAINVEKVLTPPSFEHPCGTDLLGRDVLSRLIYGARISLEVGVLAVGISLAIGVVLGALAGYFGSWVDGLISRLIDIMLCFPTIFLILAVIAYLEPSIVNIMIVIGLTSWMGVARLVRAEFLSLKEREFVLAEKALGAGHLRIIFSHILPNALPPILVSATLGVGSAILVESALSFLGLGVQPPVPSWGNMLTEGKETLEIAWWMSVFPGLAILITVLGFNLLGETIQEITDPRRLRG